VSFDELSDRLLGFVFNFFDFQRATLGLVEGFAISDTDSSVTAGGREERAKIAGNSRFDIKGFLDRIIARATQAVQQGIRGHGPGIPMATFVFIERIPNPAVVS